MAAASGGLRQDLSFAKTSPASVDDAHALATAKESRNSVIATFIDNLQRLRDGRPLLAQVQGHWSGTCATSARRRGRFGSRREMVRSGVVVRVKGQRRPGGLRPLVTGASHRAGEPGTS